MAAEDQALIQLAETVFVRNRILVLDNLDCLRPILDYLRQENILTQDDDERIMCGQTTKDKVRNLIDKLYRMRRHPTAVHEFLKCLEDHQPWLHEQLMTNRLSGESLQQRLKECYARKKGLLKKHPWATERSFGLPVGLYTNLKLIDHEESANYRKMFIHNTAFQDFCRDTLPEVSMKELFKKGAKGTRILLEGDPGIGKTTMCYKLIHDFSGLDVSENERYFVHDLLFVFLLEVRHFRGSVKETIQKSLALTDQEMSLLWRLIQTQSGKCLFIIDGLDEKTRNFPKEIRDLIEGSILSGCLVLATCRTNQANNFSDLFHQIVINVGFFQDQAFAYVRKYFSHIPTLSDSVDTVTDFLEDQIDVLGDLLKTPLNCLLLCLWLEEWMTSINNPSLLKEKHMTTTNFYEMVVRSVLKRHCKKKGIQLTRGKIPPTLKEDIVKLYKLALYGVLKEKYKFTLEDLESLGMSEDDEVLNLGFISREYSVSALEEAEDIGYSFPHRSIQDFFAAKAVNHLSDAVKRSLVAYFGKNWKTHDNICLFLCGLLEDVLLLKWLLCCTFENNEAEFQPYMPDETDLSPLLTRTNQRTESYQRTKECIQKATTIAEGVIGHLSSILCGNTDEFADDIPLCEVERCLESYRSPDWIWRRTDTGKLKDTLYLCLRGLYEVCPSEELPGSSLQSEIIKYLADLSNGKGPEWDIINDYPREIKYIVVKLWRQENCDSSLFSQRRFQLLATAETRDNTWKLIFNHNRLHMEELELTYHCTSGLVDVLQNLGPQRMHLKKLSFRCDSGMRHEGEMMRKEVEQRKAVKAKLAEMGCLKCLLIEGRTLTSCLGFLPEKVPLKELTFMALEWPQQETEELVHESLSGKVEKLTLLQRCAFNSEPIGHILRALEESVPRSKNPPSEVLLQGFRLESNGKEQFCKVKEYLESKKVTLRASECQVIVPSVETVPELIECLRTDLPRGALIVFRVLNVGESVFADLDGCMHLFAKGPDLDWIRLGEDHMKIIVRMLRAGLESGGPAQINVNFKGFERFMGAAMRMVKPQRVELLFPKKVSTYMMKSVQNVVRNGRGSIGWDHVERRVFASYTMDITQHEKHLSKKPFPEIKDVPVQL